MAAVVPFPNLREATADALGRDRKPRHDPARGIVFDVKVCGLKSDNGGQYTFNALREALGKYENTSIYLDHPTGQSNARSVHSRFGVLHGCYMRPDGMYAKELRYNVNHAFAPTFQWMVDNDHRNVGLSHNVDGAGTRDSNGRPIVKRIDTVHSVDLVDRPATTGGLIESFSAGRPYKLREATMADAVLDPAAPIIDTPPAGDAAPDSQWRDHLIDGVAAMLADLKAGAMTKAEVAKAIKSLIDMIGGEAEVEVKTDDLDANGLPDDMEAIDTPLLESLRPKAKTAVAKWALELMTKFKRREQHEKTVAARTTLARKTLPETCFTATFREQLGAARDEQHVAELIADRAKLLGIQRPKSAPPAAPAKAETTADRVQSVANSLYS